VGAIILLGLVLTVIFMFWLVVAYAILRPHSVRSFLSRFSASSTMFSGRPGPGADPHRVGLVVFAAVYVISLVVPFLLRPRSGVERRATIVQAAIINPVRWAWGLIIAGG